MLSVRSGDALVEIELDGVLAAVRRFEEEYDDVYLIFRPAGGHALDPALRDAFIQAMDHAGDRSIDRCRSGADRDQVGAQGPDASPLGPTLWFDYPGGTARETRSWLVDLAESMAAAGHSGTLGPFTELDVPDPMYDRASPPKLTAFMNFPIEDGETLLHQATSWCLALPHDVVRLDVGVNSIALPPIPAAGYLATLLDQGEPAGITCWAEGSPPARRVTAVRDRLDHSMTGAWQVHGATAGWQAQLDDLLAGIIPLAPLFENLMIRREPSWARGGRPEPDACGVQILTEAQVARAVDLSGWSLETISPGRCLVTARDLSPWFSGPDVAGEVLEAARRDLGLAH